TLPTSVAEASASLSTHRAFSISTSTSSQVPERVTGQIAHSWLEYIARTDPGNWTPIQLSTCAPRIQRQLLRAGYAQAEAEAATASVLDTLSATLSDARGRWLLQQPAQREWRLIDESGQQLVIDLAIEQDDGWLIVDYKTHARPPNENSSDFGQRLMDAYGPQLEAYCLAISAATKRPARAALYVPRAALWLEAPDTIECKL